MSYHFTKIFCFCIYMFWSKGNCQISWFKNVDEIDYRFQFHQHFMRYFLYKSPLGSFYPITVWLCDFLVKEYRKKSACKMLVKSTFKLRNLLLSEKLVRKMLVKLTPGWLRNILLMIKSDFSSIFCFFPGKNFFLAN